jgi:demethoxyubiquinone hydroxylase (CLK1/Coq7/Cat5 family)
MKHRDSAIALGAAELPEVAKAAMRVMAKAMTTVSYRI